MTPDRLRTLLSTYGADWRRWPAGERDAARALLARDAAAQQRMLDHAAQLDDWLASHAVAAPDRALSERIVAGASTTLRARRERAWWWRGAGLAAIGLAGSLAGALGVSLALHDFGANPGDWPLRATAFSALPADWSDE